MHFSNVLISSNTLTPLPVPMLKSQPVRRFCLDNACHGRNVCLGQVNNIDKVANTRSIGRIVVVAEDSKLFANANGRLREVRDEVGGRDRLGTSP